MAIASYSLQLSAGSALSAPLQIPANLRVVRIGMPANGWTSAPITFRLSNTQGMPEEADWMDLHHVAQTPEGQWQPFETSILSVIPNSSLLLPVDAGANISWLRLRSGTSSRPVNQAADRVFQIVFGP